MNTKSKVTLSIIIFLVVAIGAGLYIRHSFSEKHSDPVESSFSNLSIKNNTTKEFKSVGIAWDDNALMQKTNQNSFNFPAKLTNEARSACIVAVTSDNQVFVSGSFLIKDHKQVSLKKIADKKLELDVSTKENVPRLPKIPSLENWSLKFNDNKVEASFAAKTNNYYSLYVLGDGGELGISDKVSKNKTALASWERTENILSSWVHFYGK